MLDILSEPPKPVTEKEDYEIVLGRRHIASVLFVAIVTLAVVSAGSYLAGKSVSPKRATPAPAPAPIVQAAAPQPVPAPEPVATVEPPVFADPVSGAIYLQMGSVDRGVAVILVEGLRKHGFAAFAAPGATEKVYRVLIGPLPDPQAFARAKDSVDQIGLATFARKYEQ